MKRTRQRAWLKFVLVPVLGTLAVACGDDEDPKPMSGAGGAPVTGSGGAGGGGAGGAGGSPANPDAATSETPAGCAEMTVVEADVTMSTMWSCPTYLLKKKIYVVNNSTLTIAAGTKILGDAAATDKAALIVSRGSQLVAEGTAAAPIVFTSSAAPTVRKGGDWAGVALLGDAKINTGMPCAAGGAGCLEAGIEGIPATELKAKFGGVNDASSCGKLKYVRVEFAGAELEPMKELNGLTFGGCGSGTEVSYVQVHRGTDDGIELFGGTVNLHHVVLSGNEDDSLDWDYGWSGKVHHLVIHQRAGIGDNGIEAAGSPTMETAAPRAEPVLFNVTMVGRAGGGKAITFKEGTRGKIYNSIIQGFTGDVIDFQVKAGDLTAEWPMFLTVENTLFWMNGAFAAEVVGMPSDDDKGFDDQMAVEHADRKNKKDVDPMLGSVTDTAPNYVPANAAVGTGGAAPTIEGAAAYHGAFAPGMPAWTDGWTSFAAP